MTIDFRQVVILNESGNPGQPGDVTLFRTMGEAERYVEPIDVENGEYFAYLADGSRLNLVVVDGRVRIEPASDATDYHNTVRLLLEDLGKVVLEARRYRKRIKEEPNLSTMSIAELIEFIGF